MLDQINESAIVTNLKNRYMQDSIYVSAFARRCQLLDLRALVLLL